MNLRFANATEYSSSPPRDLDSLNETHFEGPFHKDRKYLPMHNARMLHYKSFLRPHPCPRYLEVASDDSFLGVIYHRSGRFDSPTGAFFINEAQIAPLSLASREASRHRRSFNYLLFEASDVKQDSRACMRLLPCRGSNEQPSGLGHRSLR